VTRSLDFFIFCKFILGFNKFQDIRRKQFFRHLEQIFLITLPIKNFGAKISAIFS